MPLNGVRSVLSLLLVIAVIPATAETLTGQVLGIHDGDTLTLLVSGNQQVKVRLAGIDAPELKQPYGQQAKQALSALAFSKKALVDSPAPDKYGRTLGTVTVGTAMKATEPLELPVVEGRCGVKRTCGEMTSCEEARFYLNECGLTRLEGDGDGVPCEALCNKR